MQSHPAVGLQGEFAPAYWAYVKRTQRSQDDGWDGPRAALPTGDVAGLPYHCARTRVALARRMPNMPSQERLGANADNVAESAIIRLTDHQELEQSKHHYCEQRMHLSPLLLADKQR